MKYSPDINCRYYIYGTGKCSNKNVKRAWFGIIGPRYCMLANPKDWRISCDFRLAYKYVIEPPVRRSRVKDIPLPPEPPKPPPSREIGLDLSKFFKRK